MCFMGVCSVVYLVGEKVGEIVGCEHGCESECVCVHR